MSYTKTTDFAVQGVLTSKQIQRNIRGTALDTEFDALEASSSGSVNVKEFGAVGDGVTDDTAAIQAAIDAVSTGSGGDLHFPAGTFVINAPIVLATGVNLKGSGRAHRAFYANGAYTKNGTVLKFTVDAAEDCIAFVNTPSRGHQGIYNMSIFEAGSAAFNAIVTTNSALHITMEDVELGCLNTTGRGIGLNINRPTTAGSIYGCYRNIVTQAVHTGLKLSGDVNSLTFTGGSFSGTVYTAIITNDGVHFPHAVSFNGTSFETVYDASIQEFEFIKGSKNIHGFSDNANSYICKIFKMDYGDGISFDSCYWENGSNPPTYDDGSNGSAPLASVIAIEDSASNINTINLNACRMAAYAYVVGGRSIMINGLPTGNVLDTSVPTTYIGRNATATVVATSTLTPIIYDNLGPLHKNVGTKIKYDDTSGIATFMEAGTYKIHAQIYFPSTTAGESYLRAVITTGTPVATGTHDAATSTTVCTDSGEAWTVNAYTDYLIKNTTDGSQGYIASNTATTITVGALTGGTDDDFDSGDTFEVYTDQQYFGACGSVANNRSLVVDCIAEVDVYGTVCIEMFQSSGGNVTVSAAPDYSHLHIVKV
jgi:hypothetical protein